MREASVTAPRLIEWGVATLALPGETQSGDRHLVKPVGSTVLVAVVDGLGHGAEAATAAQAAVAALERHATESPVPLLQRCHRALQGTRGAVMSVAVFARPERSMTWLGVGNVEGLLLYGDGAPRSGSTRASLVTRGGIVGSELPRLHPVVLPIAPGDTLIFATDGIREGFAEGLSHEAGPQQLADQILARHGKGTDDALVLVARYLGGAGTRG
ncbi:MAG: stage II sporulation protein E (SpoIIE) [Gemmatimonadetes bacterium]|nr:MAG: stage II sporulation protein E (SpoIIE) [Gemmatimonadota bacterium]